MDANFQSRLIVAKLEGLRSTALSMQTAAEQLLAEDAWTARLQALEAEPGLLNDSVARWCMERGDELLSMVIQRAAEAGVAVVRDELWTAVAIERVGRDDDQAWSADMLVVRQATGLVKEGASWLWLRLLSAIGRLVERIRGHVDAVPLDSQHRAQWYELRQITEPLLADMSQCDSVDITRVLALAGQPWPVVWAALPFETNIGALEKACSAAQLMTWWFEVDRHKLGYVQDLRSLFEAVERLGAEGAIQEHVTVLYARATIVREDVDPAERLVRCSEASLECSAYFQLTGASWMSEAAIATARAAHDLAHINRPRRADSSALLGGALTMAVQAGLEKPQLLNEALELQREALRLTSQLDFNYPARAADLSSTLSLAVQAGLLEPTSLIEAVDYQRYAYDLTPQQLGGQALHASNLSCRIAESVQASLLKPTALLEAVSYQREAYQSIAQNDPLRAMHASNLGCRLAESVRAGLLEPDVLREALEYQREAYDLTPSHHPHRAFYAANLSERLAGVVEAGLMDSAALTDAVKYQREAHQMTPEHHAQWARFGSDLGSRLDLAVQAGHLEPAALFEAVGYQRKAYEDIAERHPEKVRCAAHLSLLLADAARVGVAEPAVLIEAIEYQREAYALTSTSHPERAGCATNLGVFLASAVEAGLLERAALLEALEYQREAYGLTTSSHVRWPGIATNLGRALVDVYEAGLGNTGVLTEAVAIHREAYRLVASSSPYRSACAHNLASAIAKMVGADLLEPTALAEALRLQREAYKLTGRSSPHRAGGAASLAARIADAVQAGLLPDDSTAAAVQEIFALLDEVWDLLRSGITTLHRRFMMSEMFVASRVLPLLLLGSSGPQEAVRAIETLRGHLSTGMQAPRLEPGSVNDDLALRYQEAAIAYERAQLLVEEGLASHADATSSARTLSDIIEKVRASRPGSEPFGGRPLFAELCSALPALTAGIYLLLAPEQDAVKSEEEQPGAAIVIRHDGRSASIPLPGLTYSKAALQADALSRSAGEAQSVCAWLWHVFASPILESDNPILHGVLDWTVIPSGPLGSLPLHAAGSSRTGWLDDHVTTRTTSSLSTRIGRETSHVPTGSPAVAVSRATDLRFLSADRAVVLALMPDARTVEDPITPDTVLQALVEAPAAVLSGHAVHSLTDGGCLDFGPAGGRLEVPSVPRWLTAQAIERLPLRKRQWVFLSACSSGQIATDFPDEAIGLPTALRNAGFSSVISSTWPVKDHVGFISLALYLQRRALRPTEPVAESLRRIRTWLRSATRDELLVWLDDVVGTLKVTEEVLESLRLWWATGSDTTPFADPQDWAAYAVS